MKHRSILALCGAIVASILALSAAAAAAAGPAVTVRVEGKSRTLLAPAVVKTHGGSLTEFGATRGACPDTSANGALDVATHHRWRGKFSSSLGSYFITSILGDTESGTHFFWDIFVNDVAASTGACEIKLHKGDQLLFAVVPSTGTAYPLGLRAPGSATAGRPFTVKVVWFDGRGKAKPLAHARVSGGGISATTNSSGIATITDTRPGTLVLNAARNGYIRAAAARVQVSP